MERLTTDTPNGNFETLLNFVHGKDGWAHIYDEDGKEVNLITWALNHCHDRGCDDFQCETLEEYDEALSSCMMDYMDCPIAMAYCFASQAVHMRSRLKMYEDTMQLKHAQELAQAEKGGRLLVLPCKVGDMLYEVDLPEYGVITCKVLHIDAYNGPMAHAPGGPMVSAISIGVEVVEGHGKGSSYAFETPDFGKLVFLTREEAEVALKKREDMK